MESEPQRDRLAREAMEVCRPAHDDLSDLGLAFLADRLADDPLLAREFHRLKRLDQSLADAFQDVPVPEGLADRILARLASEAEATCAPGEEAAAGPLARSTDRRRRFSRRWLLVGAGSIVAAAAMLWMVGAQVGRPLPMDGSDLGQAAIEFYGTDVAENGQSITEVAPPEDYPFAADVQQPSDTRWRWVRGFFGRTAVAYDITAATGERATLYVLRATATDVADRPSPQPFVTQGCATSAWQRDQWLYVFVVKGGPQSYRRLLLMPRAPLA